MLVARPNTHDSLVGLRISAFDTLEPLQESRDDIGRFGSHQNVSRANPRPTPEGNELPHRTQMFPTFRAELFCILAPDVGVSVHQVSVAMDDVAFLDKNGRFAVRTTADGQGCVPQGYANHLNAVGIQTMS